MTAPAITYALIFPEGLFLIARGAPYYMPGLQHDKAYGSYGERKELFGKVHHQMLSRAPEFKKYDLTYEIEDSHLISARLHSRFGRSAGRLVPDSTVKMLNDRLAAGQLTLENYRNPPYVTRAAEFADGRQLLVVEGLDNGRELFIGKPGAFEPVSIKTGIQGGNHLIYTTTDGVQIDLPGGFGDMSREKPTVGNELLRYIKVADAYDLAGMGLVVPQKAPHLDPFCPEVRQPAPKGP
jgi:hypothetical protein